MSLITLSSKHENDPSKFSNYFNDMIDIQPFSYICLVKAQIVREKNQTLISIPPNTVLNIRYNCYDVSQIIINNGGGEPIVFTLPNLATEITGLIGAVGLPYQSIADVVTNDSDDGDINLQFRFYNFTTPEIQGLSWRGYIFGDADYWVTKWGQHTKDGALMPLPQAMVAGEVSTWLDTDLTEWACSPIWDTDHFTPNTNQFNKNSFSLLVEPNFNNQGAAFDYEPLQFWIHQSNPHFSLQFGRSTSNDNTPTQYLTGPVLQTPGGDPQGNPKNNLLTLQFQKLGDANDPDADVRTFIYDSDLDNWAPLRTVPDFQVNVGDYIEIQTKPTPEIPESDQKQYLFQINHYKGTGLIFAYNGNLGAITNRPGSNNYFLSDNRDQPVTKDNMNNMSYVYDLEYLKKKYIRKTAVFSELTTQFINDFTQTTADWGGNSVIGERTFQGYKGNDTHHFRTGAGWIYNPLFGQGATKQFDLSYETALPFSQYRYAASCQGFDRSQGNAQRDDGSKIEIPNVYQLFSSEVICRAPTLIAFSATFDILAETMMPSDLNPKIRTLIGDNNTNRMFEIFLSTSAAFDFRLSAQNGNIVTNILVDDGANRINFTGSDATTSYNYNFLIRWYGLSEGFQVTVIQNVTNAAGTTSTKFDAPGVLQIPPDGQGVLGQPGNFSCIGGINPFNDITQQDYNNYSPLTYISNIRLYQKNLVTNNATSQWDNVSDQMTSYFNVIPTYTNANNAWITAYIADTEAFYPYSEINLPLSVLGTDNKYTNIGCPGSLTNTLPCFQNIVQPFLAPDTTIPLINGLWVPPLNLSKNSSRNIALQGTSYTGLGSGFVEVPQDDPLDFKDPADISGNIIKVPILTQNQGPTNPTATFIAEAGETLVDNPSINVEITNLPHQTINGSNRNIDKTIYQIPTIQHVKEIANEEIIECLPPSKVWIPLNNPGLMPINKLDVQLSTVDGIQIPRTSIRQETNLVVQIENNPVLLN